MNLHLLTAVALFAGSFVVTLAGLAAIHLLITSRRHR